jgi:hypothetical protein
MQNLEKLKKQMNQKKKELYENKVKYMSVKIRNQAMKTILVTLVKNK